MPSAWCGKASFTSSEWTATGFGDELLESSSNIIDLSFLQKPVSSPSTNSIPLNSLWRASNLSLLSFSAFTASTVCFSNLSCVNNFLERRFFRVSGSSSSLSDSIRVRLALFRFNSTSESESTVFFWVLVTLVVFFLSSSESVEGKDSNELLKAKCSYVFLIKKW